VPFVTPQTYAPGDPDPLGHPQYDRGQGLQPLKGCSFSFMLFRVNIFNAMGPHPFGMSTSEASFLNRLWTLTGHIPYVDTDTDLMLAKGPHMPDNRDWDIIQARQKAIHEARWEEPDRRPLDPDDPYTIDGIYVPFLFEQFYKNEEAEDGSV